MAHWKAGIQAGLKAAQSSEPEDIIKKPKEITAEEGKELELDPALFIEIKSAVYGHGDVWQDCKYQVETALLACYGVKVGNEELGGDPCPGVIKTLKVTYIPSEGRKIEVPGGIMRVFEHQGFMKFRETCGVEEGEYFASLTDAELKGGEPEVSGKSGSLFWFSTDGRFVLKTIEDAEVFALKRMLADYTEYIGNTPDSLLCRYLGAYRFTSDDGTLLTFVVMNNVFEGCKLHAMYDLKGTSEDRWVDEEEDKDGYMKACLKDTNFNPLTIWTADETAELIRATIATDTAFLEAHSIMDYSLMCGIQYLHKDRTRRQYMFGKSSLLGGLSGTVVKGVLENSEHESCVFYIGMVDMLVTWSFKKKAAHVMKALTLKWKYDIDTEPPDVYAQRFRSHFEKKFLAKSNLVTITQVPAEYFEMPMQPTSRSGGTAAFFLAKLKASSDECPEAAESANYWIAKDLGRAVDEVGFYEAALKHRDCKGFELLKWMTPYKGVCDASCAVEENKPPENVQVLLLRNARDGYKSCRMLDIKIGWATAVSGWQGKSAFAAWNQGIVDNHTNSQVEGFRLEGFDNPPKTLRSFEQLYSTSEETPQFLGSRRLGAMVKSSKDKKLKRFQLQRMDAFDFLKHWLDLHDTSASSYAKSQPSKDLDSIDNFIGNSGALLSEVELQELLLLNCIEELCNFVAASRDVAVPQQWIGSSVMLAFDCLAKPSRDEILGKEAPWQGLSRVHIFDWGRSELNTPSLHKSLSESSQEERKKYWGLYCGGIAKLLYDCCSLYVGRYWYEHSGVHIGVWDKDTWSDDDFIGKCTVSTDESCSEKSIPITDWAGSPVKVGRGLGGLGGYVGLSLSSQVVVSLGSLDMPENSRLQHGSTIKVHKATDLPNMDASVTMMDHTDAYVEVVGRVASTVDMSDNFKQVLRNVAHNTTLAMDTENPVFEEQFQIASLKPEAKAPFLKAVSTALGREISSDDASRMFLSQKHVGGKDHHEVGREFAVECFPDLTLFED